MVSAPTCCGNVPWRRASIRCLRSSPRRRPAGCTTRRFIRGFRNSCRIPLRGCSGRFAAQASPGSVPADNEDGPVERLQNAGWELIQWRDFEGDWQRPPFDRQSRIDALVQRLHEFADLSASPAYQYDSFCLDTRAARQLSDDIVRTEKVAARDYSRLEGMLIDLGRNRQFRQARKGSGKFYRPNVPREDVTRARDELQAELTRFETDANADLAVLLREELRPCCREVRRGEGRRRRARFPRPAPEGSQSRARRRRCAAQLSAALQASVRRRVSGHRSAAGRNPAAPGRRRSARDRLAESPTRSRQALHRRRPEAVHLPVQARGRRNLSQRLRDAARGGSEARHAAHQLPRQAEHPAHDQRVVRAGHDG